MKEINLFYADDDEDDLMFFNEAVEKISGDFDDKIILHVHKNGEKLIENIKKIKAANGVAFLDINMPFKSGFQLLEEIRKEAGLEKFPVIMYSTSSNPDNIEKSRSLGANFYVVKPYEFRNLLKMISSFIELDWKSHQAGKDRFLYQSE